MDDFFLALLYDILKQWNDYKIQVACLKDSNKQLSETLERYKTKSENFLAKLNQAHDEIRTLKEKNP